MRRRSILLMPVSRSQSSTSTPQGPAVEAVRARAIPIRARLVDARGSVEGLLPVAAITGKGRASSDRDLIVCDLVARWLYAGPQNLASHAGAKAAMTRPWPSSGQGPAVRRGDHRLRRGPMDRRPRRGRRQPARRRRRMGPRPDTPDRQEDEGAAGITHPWPITQSPGGKDFIDFDEDLRTRDIINSVHRRL